jgi:hypothetical protein
MLHDLMESRERFDCLHGDLFEVGGKCFVRGDLLPVCLSKWQHFESSFLVFGLGELGLESALDDLTGAAGTKEHGKHVVNGRERVGALLREEEAEVTKVHIRIGDEIAKVMKLDDALEVVGSD